MDPLERAVEYAEYLVETAKHNPTKLLTTSSPSSASKSKSLHQRLLDLYIEECNNQPEGKKLLHATHLLPKLVKRDKLNCLILKLYPGNEGYSLMLRTKTGIETETFKLPYEVSELLEYIDDSELPPLLVDILDKAQVNVFYSGCVIVEVRDYRRAINGSFDAQHVLLRPGAQSLLCDIQNITNDGQAWTPEDQLQLESKLLLATEEPLCLDPSPAVLLVANKLQYERKKLNTPLLKRSVKSYTQAAVNRKRKFAQSASPKELRLHDFVHKKKDKKANPPVNLKIGKSHVDSWKQRQVQLTPPETVDVEKFAKVLPESSSADNSMVLVEEHTLERDVTTEKRLMAKLTIRHCPGDNSHYGELYLDHDYVEGKSRGASCKFFLGSKDAVQKYLDQFSEIFTEEGRRSVKLTVEKPGQPTFVTCTVTTPTVASFSVAGNQTLGLKHASTTSATSATTQCDTSSSSSSSTTGGIKRTMPIQLSLSIGPAGTINASSNLVSPQTGSTPTSQATNQLQLNIQQQQTDQSHSASQRLKQLGIHTNIARQAGTPSASPVATQSAAAQLFSSPQNSVPVTSQGGGTKSASSTPTPTPTPSPIISPPPVTTSTSRKSSLTSESSTVHHLAQTPHHANVATFIPGTEGGSAQGGGGGSVGHQTGVANIITGIPPNINIQHLTGLPGMNIANLSGLQNMQVSLSVPGGIAVPVPISMISSNTVLGNQAGILVSSLPGTSSVSSGRSGSSVVTALSSHSTSTATVTAPSTLVTMVTALPTSTSSSQATVTTTTVTSQVVSGVLTTQSSVLTAPTGMLSLPIGLTRNITQLVPAMQPHGGLRTSTSLPLLQFNQQGIQLVNLPQQRAPLKTGATLQTVQALNQGQQQPGNKGASGSGSGTTASTALLTTPTLGGQQVLSHLSIGKQGQPIGGTTLTHQQLLQLAQPQFGTLQKQPLQFHQIPLKQATAPAPGAPQMGQVTSSSKSKNKKRTTPTPPKN